MIRKFKWEMSKEGTGANQYISTYRLSEKESPDWYVKVYREAGSKWAKWSFVVGKRGESGPRYIPHNNKKWASASAAKDMAIMALFNAQGLEYQFKLRKAIKENLAKGTVMLLINDKKSETPLKGYCKDKALDLTETGQYGIVTPEDVEQEIKDIMDGEKESDVLGGIRWMVEQDLTF